METVQLQCGHCQQLMAVSVQHLGGQVHCPHCQNVVEVPEANVIEGATRTDDDNLSRPRLPTQDEESILAPGPSARVPLPDPSPTWLESQPSSAPPSESLTSPRAFAAAPDEEDLPVPTIPRRREQPSLLVPILLLFLIPYAIATTAFIAWLIYSQNRNHFEPLERLRDPKPDEGGPRQIKHDLKVSTHLRAPLNQALRVGDLEVTPVKILRTDEGDLALTLDMKNVAHDIEFNPMHDDFVKYREDMDVGVYTFLEPLNRKVGDRLYGGYLEWLVHDGNEEKRVPQDHCIKPGERMTIVLTTREQDREHVQRLLAVPQEALWRVQVRRGFLSTRKGPLSATSVIGVDFNTSAIRKAT